jgi:hypothetical protein
MFPSDSDTFFAAVTAHYENSPVWNGDPDDVGDIPADFVSAHVKLPTPGYTYFCTAYGDLCAYTADRQHSLSWNWEGQRWDVLT